jgi:hypothetical protein
MKTILGFILAAILCIFAPAALAQGHGSHAGGGSFHTSAAPHENHSAPQAKGEVKHGNTAVQNGHGWHNDYHGAVGYRGHWDGHVIEHNYFVANFGVGHCFYPGRPYWYGGWYRFGWGGFYFGLYDPWPWYDASYYIDYDGDVYWAYSPQHPGWRVRVYVLVD